MKKIIIFILMFVAMIGIVTAVDCTSVSPLDGFGDAGAVDCGTGCCYNNSGNAVCNASGTAFYDYYDFGDGDGISNDYCYNSVVYDCIDDSDCMAGYECNMFWECVDEGVDDVTGWSELLDGNIIGAIYVMYNVAFVGWFVAILFFVFQIVLYIKTQNATACWAAGLLFGGTFAVALVLKPITIQVMFAILVLELAGIIFVWIMK